MRSGPLAGAAVAVGVVALTVAAPATSSASAPGPAPASPARSSTAQASNRAGLVIDLGDGGPPRTVCVRFAEDSITGKELLERAKVDAVFSTYSGEGSAVCALCGKGCPDDGSCLTCQQPDYWAYHRAPAGASGWSYGRAGASRTTVRDGDVEGWRWGTGSAPPFRTIVQVCGGEASSGAGTTTTTAAPRRTTTTAGPADGGGGGGEPRGGSSGDARPGGAPDGTGAGGGTPSPAGAAADGAAPRLAGRTGAGPGATVPGGAPAPVDSVPPDVAETADAARADAGDPATGTHDVASAVPARDAGDASSPAASLAGFASAVAVVGALVVRARRRPSAG